MRLLIYEVREMRETLFLDFLPMQIQTSQNGLQIFKTYKIITKTQPHQIAHPLMLVIHSLLLK